jgi:hypothetical protein
VTESVSTYTLHLDGAQLALLLDALDDAIRLEAGEEDDPEHWGKYTERYLELLLEVKRQTGQE